MTVYRTNNKRVITLMSGDTATGGTMVKRGSDVRTGRK